VFEEAAGLALSHTQRRSSQTLEATRRNLERAQDILDEITRLAIWKAGNSRPGIPLSENLQNKLRLWYGFYWYKAQEES
jgi:hypothetical protein